MSYPSKYHLGRSLGAALVLAFAMVAHINPAAACGPETDCKVEGGTYRLQLPDGWDGSSPLGVVIHMHGWQNSAAGAMRNQSLRRAISELGYALVVPNGRRKTWSYPRSPSQHRDEFAFFDALLADLPNRFPVNEDRRIATGFSMGGSMAWYLACYRGEAFAGVVPIAGAFWDPQPETCPSPVPNIVHVHGTADRTVPMTGRPIGANHHQGDVRNSLKLWTDKGQCTRSPTKEIVDGRLTCARRTDCDGRLISLCLHDGAHSYRTEWVVRGIEVIAEHNGW